MRFGREQLIIREKCNQWSFLVGTQKVILIILCTELQLELFDYKPALQKLHGLDCPQSLLEGKRFAFIQGVPKMLGPQFDFKQYGQSGTYISDALPHFSTVPASLFAKMIVKEFGNPYDDASCIIVKIKHG